jgi:hypothetical protein
MKPELIIDMKYSLKEKLLILVDGSSSMQLPFKRDNKEVRRYDKCEEYIRKYIDENIKKRFEIKKVEFSTIFKDYNFQKKATEGLTNIGKAVFYDDDNRNVPDNILLFTDGIVTSGQSLELLAGKINRPIFTVGVGEKLNISDIYINSIIYEKEVYKD